MEVKKGNIIQVSLSRTINLGNYENVKVDVGITKELTSKEDAEEEIVKLTDSLSAILKEKGKEYRKLFKNKSV